MGIGEDRHHKLDVQMRNAKTRQERYQLPKERVVAIKLDVRVVRIR